MVCQYVSTTVASTDREGNRNRAAIATQQMATAAMIPPINSQFVGFGAACRPVPAAAWAASAGVAIFGRGDPQFEQTALLLGFSVPQLSHLITFCSGEGGCISRPDSRALPSSRSP